MRPRRRSVRVTLRQEVVWELLDQLNISQNELARRCGISRSKTSQDTIAGTMFSTTTGRETSLLILPHVLVPA